jgi:hypothetical protein
MAVRSLPFTSSSSWSSLAMSGDVIGTRSDNPLIPPGGPGYLNPSPAPP